MFETVGAKSRRELLVEAVEESSYGDVLPYEALGQLFGLTDRTRIQGAVNGAKRSVEVNCSKTLVAIPNEGYRVADPTEHYVIATHHQRKGSRQTKKALSKVQHVDTTGMCQEDRDKLVTAQTMLSAFQAFERRADLRYANRQKMDEFIAEQDKKNKRSESELSSMQDRIARLESKLTA